MRVQVKGTAAGVRKRTASVIGLGEQPRAPVAQLDDFLKPGGPDGEPDGSSEDLRQVPGAADSPKKPGTIEAGTAEMAAERLDGDERLWASGNTLSEVS